MSLRSFTGLYSLLLAGVLGISYFYGSLSELLYAAGFGVAGLVISILIVGVFGGKISQTGTKAVMAALGLFPWLLSGTVTMWYAISLAVFVIVSILLSMRKGDTAVVRKWTRKKRNNSDGKITVLSPNFGLMAVIVSFLIFL